MRSEDVQKIPTTRRNSFENDRAENRNILQILWNKILEELFKSYDNNEKPGYENLQFLGVLNAIADFLRIYNRKYDAHTKAEEKQYIQALAAGFSFNVLDHVNPDFNQNFYTKLEAFIAGTQAFFANMQVNSEETQFFTNLREWAGFILEKAIPSYAPPYSKKINTETAKLYCEAYHAEQKLRLKKLLWIGRGMAVFNECNALRLTEMDNLDVLPLETILDVRVGFLQQRFAVLKDALRKIGVLTFELEQILRAEEKECITLLEDDPTAVLIHPCVDHILRALEHYFDRINITASFLNYYMPNLEHVEHQDEPLFNTIRLFYFTDKLSHSGKVPEVAQAINILNEDYTTIQEQERNKLLGDKGTLSTENLDFLLLIGCPVLEQLRILENLYEEISLKNSGKYAQPKRLFKQRTEIEGFTPTQISHIKILQYKYLALVAENRTAEVIEAVEKSSLLNLKLVGTQKIAKDEAWRLFDEEQIVSSESSGDKEKAAKRNSAEFLRNK